jgi:hypothetical protein
MTELIEGIPAEDYRRIMDGQLQPIDVVREALAKSKRLDVIHQEWQHVYRDAAAKHAAYKKAWAQAIVTAKGNTVDARTSLAEMETNSERIAHEDSEAHAEILKMAQFNVRKQLELLTACAYLLKGEAAMAGRYE